MGEMWRDQAQVKAKIPALQVESTAIPIRQFVLPGLSMPAGFEGTELTFKVSDKEDGAFLPLNDDQGTQVKLPVAASQAYALPAALAPFSWFKIVSNAPGGEDAERTLILSLKG